MSSKSIDRSAPVQGAIVIHPERDDRGADRSGEARLEEAIGLALALDLEVREAIVAPLRKLTPATLFGSGKVEEIHALCEAADVSVAVVEDNAHGLFGKYKGRWLGTLGALATQSFHETKNITCGEGGALLVNDKPFNPMALAPPPSAMTPPAASPYGRPGMPPMPVRPPMPMRR